MSAPLKRVIPFEPAQRQPEERREEIDRAIVGLLAERQKLAATLDTDPQKQLQAVLNLAREIGLNPDVVQRVFKEIDPKRREDPYPLAGWAAVTEPTVIRVGPAQIGGDSFCVIAGPCSVESRDQVIACAREAKAGGATFLRGGCFKARTSPYSFQGLGYDGLELLAEAGATFGLPIITEVLSPEDVMPVAARADVLQVGARNMQNFALLKAVGSVERPVMLKRGISASVHELLLAAEYILSHGNRNVFLCERGIRTFETSTRNTLDISAIPVLKTLTHLPIIVDPSHAAGRRDLIPALALASRAVGAHGVMIEIHPDPEHALSDGPQALRFEEFGDLMRKLMDIRV